MFFVLVLVVFATYLLRKYVLNHTSRRRKESLFIVLIIENFLVLEFALCIFFLAYSQHYFLNPIYISYVYAVAIYVGIVHMVLVNKPKLLQIDYTGENRHLFSKYISILELCTTCAIAFLLGALPMIISYLSITDGSEMYYLINIFLVYLSCASYSASRLLNHTCSVWVANHQKFNWRSLSTTNRRNIKHNANQRSKW